MLGTRAVDAAGMPDDAMFLGRLCVAPHDLAERLVYADWLDQRSDPRADAVRHVVSMAEAPMRSDAYWAAKAARSACREVAGPGWWEVVDPAAGRTRLTCDPDDRSRRWRAMDAWLDRWSKQPLTGISASSYDRIAACETRLGFELPASLRELFTLLDGRDDLLRGSDPWHTLEELEWCREAGFEGLVIRTENQGVASWGIRAEHLDDKDPPVTTFRFAEPRIETSEVSRFALLHVAQTVSCQHFFAGGIFDTLEGLRAPLASAGFVEVDLGPMGFWVYEDMRVFEHPAAMVFAGSTKRQVDVWLPFREEGLFEGLPQALRHGLDRHV
ncbi:MAG: TIGR02996 domain-containing protein [Myxococcales bacterium]|nr:TIGR02996 domain-containing protein [Myxococcales bacterium]